MSKLWHRAAVFGVSASLLLGGVLSATAASAAPQAGPGSSASPSPGGTPSPSPGQDPGLTISASAALGKVSGYTLVVYEGGRYATATIKGQVTGAASGDVVRLYAQRFPFHRHPGLLDTVKLTRSSHSYSFKVTPTIATHYQVKLVSPGSGSSAAPLATSSTRTVYITSGGRLGVKRGCGTGKNCRPQYRFYLYLPASLIRHYVSRHWDVYVGIRRSARHVPGKPRYLYLDTRAWVHKARRITGRQYERTLGFKFHVGRKAATWNVLACERDQEAKDGVGLPGRHGCGLHRVRRTVTYLG